MHSNNSSFINENNDINPNTCQSNNNKITKNDRYTSIPNSESKHSNEARDSLNNYNLQSRPREDEQFEFEVDKFTF